MRVELVAVALLLTAGTVLAEPAPSTPPAPSNTAPAAPPVEPVPAPNPGAVPGATLVSPEPARPVAACVPECRSGFVCVLGACVSACNPPCPTGQECADGGRCVASQPTVSKETVKQAIDEYFVEQREVYRAKNVRRHDGWYVRFGFNAGYAWDTAERGEIDTRSRGAGGFLEYAVGGNITDHMVWAFAQHTFGVFSPATSVDGAEIDSDHTAFYHVIGLLFDYYPDPTDGWHVTLTLGPGFANVQVRNDESTASGLGLLLGGGYDFWVGEQWSLGAGARLIYISGAEDDFGEHRAIIPTLTFSALLH